MLTATGAAALIYQLVWARRMTLVVGATSRAAALVFATFMLGTAIGAALLSRYGDRVKRPLRLFGWLELGIAITGVTVTWASEHLGLLHGYLPYAMVFLLSMLLLLIPTTLMGATLPVMLAYIDRTVGRGEKTRRMVGYIYSGNTFGALLGALLAGFFLIEHFGLRGSALVAAGLEVTVWAITMLNRDRPAALEREQLSWPRGPAALAVAVSGFTVLAYEVLFMRMLLQGFLGTAYALTIILGGFLAGLALGAAIAPVSKPGDSRSIGLVLVAGGVLALAFGPIVTTTPALIEYLRGGDLSFSYRLFMYGGISVVLVGLPATVWGMTFPMAASQIVRSGNAASTLGAAFFINTLAAVFGSLLTGLVLLPALGTRGALIAVAAIQLIAGVGLIALEKNIRLTAVTFIMALTAIFAAWPDQTLELGKAVPVPPHVVGHELEHTVRCFRDGETSTTTVLHHKPSGRISLILDGFGTAATGSGTDYMPMMGHLPLLAHPEPRNALVICFGTGATVRAVASWQIDYRAVEINKDVIACSEHFTPENLAVVAHVTIADGRAFLQRTEERFDVITLEPMPPYFAGAVNLYSAEYYQLAKRRMSVDGVVAQWLPLHLVTSEDARQIMATIQSVFPYTYLFIMPGDGTGIALGSGVPIDLRAMASRSATAPAAFQELDVSPKSLRSAIVLGPAGVRRYTAGAPLITDDRPRLEYSGVDHVLGHFKSGLALQRHNLQQIRERSRKNNPHLQIRQ